VVPNTPQEPAYPTIHGQGVSASHRNNVIAMTGIKATSVTPRQRLLPSPEKNVMMAKEVGFIG